MELTKLIEADLLGYKIDRVLIFACLTTVEIGRVPSFSVNQASLPGGDFDLRYYSFLVFHSLNYDSQGGWLAGRCGDERLSHRRFESIAL